MQSVASLLDWILALELWWVSLALSGTSFALAFEIYDKFSSDIKKLSKNRLASARSRLKEIITKGKVNDIEYVEDELSKMGQYYQFADEPSQMYRSSLQLILFAAFVFLGSVLIRAGIDYRLLDALMFTPWEFFTFSIGLVAFLTADVNTYRLMKLVHSESESDPASKSLIESLPAILLLALYTYWLWVTVQSGVYRVTPFGLGMVLSLLPTYAGGAWYLFGKPEGKRQLIWFFLLMTSPFLYLLIVIVGMYLWYWLQRVKFTSAIQIIHTLYIV